MGTGSVYEGTLPNCMLVWTSCCSKSSFFSTVQGLKGTGSVYEGALPNCILVSTSCCSKNLNLFPIMFFFNDNLAPAFTCHLIHFKSPCTICNGCTSGQIGLQYQFRAIVKSEVSTCSPKGRPANGRKRYLANGTKWYHVPRCHFGIRIPLTKSPNGCEIAVRAVVAVFLFLICSTICGSITIFVLFQVGVQKYENHDDNELQWFIEQVVVKCVFLRLYNSGWNVTIINDNISQSSPLQLNQNMITTNGFQHPECRSGKSMSVA